MVHVCNIFILIFLVRNVSCELLVLYNNIPLGWFGNYVITLFSTGLQAFKIKIHAAVELFYFRVGGGHVSVQG